METKRKSRQNSEIRNYLLYSIEQNLPNIVSNSVKKFGVTRGAINKYLQKFIDEGIVEGEGNTRARFYKLKNIVDIFFLDRLMDGVSEDIVWRYKILPYIKNVKPNIVGICEYGFTEMLNNAIDHSASFEADIGYQQTHNKITMVVRDEGVGIFEKIQKDFHLEDPRTALLELSKGKLTSDKKNHAGEGIFFTSRMFDHFSIRSGKLFYNRERKKGDEWLIEVDEDFEYLQGTFVTMEIGLNAGWTTTDVFNEYQGDSVGFRRTHVPIKLGQYVGEQLVSRSQAKRILARFDKFSEVFLDFDGVETIGQAFADEIFRVFKISHPEVRILAIGTTKDVDRMIAHVTAGIVDAGQYELFKNKKD